MNELQQMRYSTEELSLIKNTFAENPSLLKAIRKHFLQLSKNENEKELLHGLTQDTLKLLRRFFLPTLEGDEPLNQIIDLWMTINLQDKTPETAFPHIQARDLVIRYLEQQLRCLEQDYEEELKFSDFTSLKPKEVYKFFIARNTIVQHVEQQLTQIYLLAGQKDETTEQTLERLKKNSNK